MRRPVSRLLPALLVGAAALTGAAPLVADSENVGPFGDEASLATARSRAAAEKALRWLDARQTEDGAWICDHGFKLNDTYHIEKAQVPHVGVTALAGTAFLASGSVPGRGPYARNVEKAIEFLLKAQDEDGFISEHGTRMYSHAFATMFLAEVYGMTRDPKVRDALTRAVEFTYKAQNKQGGWRYVANAEDSDMSITVCQVVALRAAKNKGIAVPKESIDAAVEYVIKSAITDRQWVGSGYERGAFLYQYQAKNQSAQAQTRTSFALTAAGLTTLYGAGIYTDQDIRDFARERKLDKNPLPRFEDMLRYVQRHYDDVATVPWHYFYGYGNYYAVQAMFIAGGEWWPPFYTRLRDDLCDSQQPDGSWPSNVGEAFSTSVGAIVLQVPNNYLPIFQR